MPNDHVCRGTGRAEPTAAPERCYCLDADRHGIMAEANICYDLSPDGNHRCSFGNGHACDYHCCYPHKWPVVKAEPTAAPGAVDLDAIDARANAATRGPWRPQREPEPVGNAWFDNCPVCSVPIESIGTSAALGCAVGCTVRPEDAVFASAARTDVPALTAEVRRLRAQLADVAKRAAIAALHSNYGADTVWNIHTGRLVWDGQTWKEST